MDRRLAREVRRANKQEIRSERKESKLHARATKQATRGNLKRAALLEARATNMHHRAENAHARKQAATAALIQHHSKGNQRCCQGYTIWPNIISGCQQGYKQGGKVTYPSAPVYPLPGDTHVQVPPVGNYPPAPEGYTAIPEY